MNATKMARMQACARCERRVAERGWPWPRCGPNGAWLDEAFMEGPAANCPNGNWNGIHHRGTEGTENGDKLRGTKKGQTGASVVFNPDLSIDVLRDLRASVVNGCLFGRKATACGGRIECWRSEQLPRVVTRADCASCEQRMERLRISAVITTWNEGDEVRKTVESLAASIEKDTTDLEIIVVDDGSTDGSGQFMWASAPGLPVPVLRMVRHETPQGVGRSRNAGYAAATGDVVTFHDAHMRMGGIGAEPGGVADGRKGGLEHLAMKALQSGAIVCAASAGLKVIDGKDTPWGCRYWGCDLFHNFQSGLEAKWRHIASDVPPEEWLRSPCMMGAGYVLSRRTAERLAGATGALWEDVAGRWGFSEEALSVKAFLLDIPVLFSRDVIFRHAYRGTNPVKNAGTEKWRNITRSTRIIFNSETWEDRFAHACQKHLGAADIAQALLDPARRVGKWPVPFDRIFTHLCGKRAPVLEPHPDQAWLSEIEAACRAGWARFAQEAHGTPARFRVLQWRPGEATVLVRRLLPQAEIVCIEAPGHRASNWAGWCEKHGVRLVKAELGPSYSSPSQVTGQFDLILIGGEMQAECKAAAVALLGPGGAILVNPGMERLQIIDEERRKEEAAALAYEQSHHRGTESTENDNDMGTEKQPLPSVAVDPSPAAVLGDLCASVVKKPLVTVCLLNWQREANIGLVLDSLRMQTVPLQVYLWNNGKFVVDRPLEFRAGDGPMRPITEHPLVKLYVQSSENLGCFPRWALAALADTEFVCSLDDDLALADPKVLEDAIAACREECPEGIVGLFGYSQVAGRDYVNGYHPNGVPAGQASIHVDVVKGRFMLMRRAVLERVPLEISALSGIAGLSHREDDIYVSLCVSGGQPGFHVIPSRLGRRWRELDGHGTAASTEPGHYRRRDEYFQRIWAWLNDSPQRHREHRERTVVLMGG